MEVISTGQPPIIRHNRRTRVDLNDKIATPLLAKSVKDNKDIPPSGYPRYLDEPTDSLH